MVNHPNRRGRIDGLGARVMRVPEREEIPDLVARITRLWAELHEADAALAKELARKLPHTRVTRG